MSLDKAMAKRNAQQGQDETPTLRTNPEIDAEITKYMEANSDRVERLRKLPKEELVRKVAYEEMKRTKYRTAEDQRVREWVEANPDIKEKVEHRIRNVSEERREAAFISAAKRIAAEEAMRSPKQSAGVKV